MLRFIEILFFPDFFPIFLQVDQYGADEIQFVGYEELWSASVQECLLLHLVCDF
jgi:hypothetical protein